MVYLTEAAFRESQIGLESVSAVAVSVNPGLIGSLLVGLSFAKSLAWSRGIPLIVVNHMLAHIFANLIEHPGVEAPFLALVVSGGHTELVLFHTFTRFEVKGRTIDDAAGEAFDKTAKLMGLGFPGGPVIDRLAQSSDPEFVRFPRAMMARDNHDFSYSGLKTAVLSYIANKGKEFVERHRSDIAASVQQAILDPLIAKCVACARDSGVGSILLGGGVAANTALRAQLRDSAAKHGIGVVYPSLPYCMDNAAMVGAAAIPKFAAGLFAPLSVNAFSQKGTKAL
jgi:N6-L-threonylcarbamoyladenine synthase